MCFVGSFGMPAQPEVWPNRLALPSSKHPALTTITVSASQAAHLEALELLEASSSLFLLAHGCPDICVDDISIFDRLRHQHHFAFHQPQLAASQTRITYSNGSRDKKYLPASRPSVDSWHSACLHITQAQLECMPFANSMEYGGCHTPFIPYSHTLF